MSNDRLIVYGLGQLGQLFGGGALRLGRTVTPIVRATDRARVWRAAPDDTPLLVAVGEAALPAALEDIPAARREQVILLQNELFPAAWEAHGISAPTVAVVWFSKKKGRPVEVARPTEVWGRHAALMVALHEALGLPATLLSERPALERALVAKYAFILTINSLGLVENLPLGTWLDKDPALVDAVIADAHRLGNAHLGHPTALDAIRGDVREAMGAMAGYPARGRTAEERLARADADSVRLDVELPTLLGLGLLGARG